MKNAPFRLDILFLGCCGTITEIHHAAKPNDPTIISSQEPVWGVFEIAGGEARALQIAVGDRVSGPEIKSFDNVQKRPQD